MRILLVIAVVGALGPGCERKQPPQRERAAPPLRPSRPPDATPAPPPVPFGEQCVTVGRAACQRLASCSGIGADACLDVLVAQCCPDGTEAGNCLEPSTYSRDRIESCAGALRRQPCDDRKRNAVPAACDGLMAE